MGITGGFGTTMDLERGTMRQWVIGRDGVKRWADTNEPVATTCRTCGAEGFRLTDGLCDGCHELKTAPNATSNWPPSGGPVD